MSTNTEELINQRFRSTRKTLARDPHNEEAGFAAGAYAYLVSELARARQSNTKKVTGDNGERETVLIPLNEQDVISVVRKVAKGASEFLGHAAEQGSDEQVLRRAQFESELFESLLPQKLDEAQTRELVQQIIADTGATQIGAVMGKLKGRSDIDMRVASTIAKSELAG